MDAAFVGAWELVSFTSERNGVVTYPYGPDAVGALLYTPDGFVSAHLGARNRPHWAAPALASGTAEERAGAMLTFRSYCGRARFLPAQGEHGGVVEHELTHCSFPNRVGRTLRRRVAFVPAPDDRGVHLVLEPDGGEAGAEAGVRETLVWRRPAAAAPDAGIASLPSMG